MSNWDKEGTISLARDIAVIVLSIIALTVAMVAGVWLGALGYWAVTSLGGSELLGAIIHVAWIVAGFGVGLWAVFRIADPFVWKKKK